MTEHRPWYVPVGEPVTRARAEAVVATFRDEAVRVGRGLRARMEARRPGVAVRTRLFSAAELAASHARPRFEGEPVLYLGVASYDDPNRPEVCGVVLVYDEGAVETRGEPR